MIGTLDRRESRRPRVRFVAVAAPTGVWWGLLAPCVVWGAAWADSGSGNAGRGPAPGPQANTPLTEIRGWAPAAPPTPLPEDEIEAVAARCAAARALLAQGQYARAVIELDAAIKASGPLGHDVLVLLARAKRGLGRDGEARLAAEAALRLRPASVEAHLLLGRLHRAQGRLDMATAHLRSATLRGDDERDHIPGSTIPDADRALIALACYELGDALAEAGHWRAATEALARFDQVTAAETGEIGDNAELAELLRRHPYGTIDRQLELLRPLDQPAERVALAETALRHRPGEPYLQRLYVQTLVDAGRAADAFEFCRERLGVAGEITATAPSSPTAADTLISLAVETGRAAGRLEEWVRELAGAVRAGHGAEPVLRVARRLEILDDRLAVVLWQAIAEAMPRSAEVQWALANALRATGNLSAALDCLIQFVRVGGDAAEIPPERLAAWMHSFDATEDFLRHVRSVADRPDSDFATHTVLATTAAAAGHTELAERLFELALAERPDFALARLGRGRMWLAAGRWEAALAEAEAALQTAPHRAAVHFLAAQAHAGLDEHDAAEAAYKRAVEESPDNAAYTLALARHYRQTGNLLGAQRYFQEVCSADPRQGEAVEELIDCYLEGGKAEIARQVLHQAEASDLPADTLRRIRTALRFATTPMQAEHLAELDRQWAEHPDDVVTGLKLAAGLFMHQRPDEALPVAEQVFARAPDDERAVYLLAQIHLRRLEGPRALALLEPLVRRYPRRPQALRLLADAYLAEFRIAEARHTFDRLLALPIPAEQRNAVRLALLATFLELADYEGALQRVEAWLADTDDADAWARAKLRVLLAAQRESEAVAWATLRLEPVTRRFEELRRRAQTLAERLRSSPDDADALAQIKHLERELTAAVEELFDRRAEWIQTCLDAERYGTAERQARLWLAEQPEQFQLQEWLIQALLAGEQAAAALSACERLVPTSAAETLSAIVWRARCRAATGQMDAALDDLTQLLNEGFVRESPLTQDQLRQEMIGLLVDAGDIDRALALGEQWLRDAPGSDRLARVSALRLLRYVLGKADRLPEQAEIMEQLLEFQPHDPGLNNDLGYTWADRGEHLERALKMVRRAVAAEPLNGAYLDSLGWVYYKMGRFEDARTYLARAVQLRSGHDAVVLDHLGDAEFRLGDPAAARRRWQEALALLEATDGTSGSEEMIAALRGKLAALDRSQPPAVAPTAEERNTMPPTKDSVGVPPAREESP